MRSCLPLVTLAAALLTPSSLYIQPVHGGATAEAEQKLYASDTPDEPPPRFPDYHSLLDWYYSEVGAGRKPDAQSLKDEIRSTMEYRLAQPQVYYDGTGYVPGVDEGWRPDVDIDTYRRYREERDEVVHKMRSAMEVPKDQEKKGKG